MIRNTAKKVLEPKKKMMLCGYMLVPVWGSEGEI